jgi:hypothetical protein
VKWTPNSPPTSLGFTYTYMYSHITKSYQIWLLLLSYAMCTRVKHQSLNTYLQQFRNSNVTTILLCLFDVASSIVTSSITSIFFANSIVKSSITSIFVSNSIVTSSITSILRYLLLWTIDARCFRKYRFSDTLSYYLKTVTCWIWQTLIFAPLEIVVNLFWDLFYTVLDFNLCE